MNRFISPIRSSISLAGRAQFSEEKLKMVRYCTPISIAARTVRRTASTPMRCPAERGSPRACAQRPLPSMMMATWRGTCARACSQAADWLCSFMSIASRSGDRRLRGRDEQHSAAAGGDVTFIPA